jgi:hypothetical protein
MKKLYYYIGIHFIASNNIDMQKLSIELEKQITKYLPSTSIILEANEPYWKYPECNSIVYSILNNQNINVSDLLTLFPITWNYSKGHVFNVDIQQQVDNETAIWNQNCSPKESFLMPKVEWVHIYTWETDKKSIIN